MVHLFHAETYEKIPAQFSRLHFSGMFSREINLYIGKHAGTFSRIYPFQFDKSCSVRTETIVLQKERHQDSVQQANKVFRFYPIEDIVRKCE